VDEPQAEVERATSARLGKLVRYGLVALVAGLVGGVIGARLADDGSSGDRMKSETVSGEIVGVQVGAICINVDESRNICAPDFRIDHGRPVGRGDQVIARLVSLPYRSGEANGWIEITKQDF
jgi:hypothetical protein